MGILGAPQLHQLLVSSNFTKLHITNKISTFRDYWCHVVFFRFSKYLINVSRAFSNEPDFDITGH